MKLLLENYTVFPCVVRSGENTTVTIAPKGKHAAFEAGRAYTVRLMPMEHSIEPLPNTAFPSVTVTPVDGVLRFSYVFTGEERYQIRVLPDPDLPEHLRFDVFSLSDELYALRPFHGDLHVHTMYSDGKEEPAVVAANYRKHGYDFLAITDHRKYAPSLEAIERVGRFDTDLKLYPGEEVHCKDSYLHYIAFGNASSLNDIIINTPDVFDREVEEIARTLELPEGFNRRQAAIYHWCVRKVRSFGGVGIFPHPHWIARVYHVPTEMIDYVFDQRLFDAFELLGGQTVIENNMQTAYYYDKCARLGGLLPVVGSSDSHGTVDVNWFDWTSTIAFAKSADEILAAVRGGMTVALEHYPGEQTRIHGSYRLARYAQFLLEWYYPQHKEMCYEEGRLLKKAVLGCEESARLLSTLKGRVYRFTERFFGTC